MRFDKFVYRGLTLLGLFIVIVTPFLTALVGNLPIVPEIPAARAAFPTNLIWVDGGTGSQFWLWRNGTGESFTVKVEIDTSSSGDKVYAWQFALGWDASILDYVSYTDGGFLPGGFFVAQPFEDEVGIDYVLFSSTLTGPSEGVSGSGTLATVVLNVQSTGATLLDVFDTKLRDSVLLPIDHIARDGYFTNVPLLYVSPGFPDTLVGNPPIDEGVIFVYVDGVTDLFTFGFKLGWAGPPPIIVATAVDDGGFLGGGFFSGQIFLTNVLVGATLTGQVPGVDGSGILAIVSFKFNEAGNSTLALIETSLQDHTGAAISHAAVNGTLSTTVPKCSFTIPLPPAPTSNYAANQTVTFNATDSFDPDGGSIVSYNWTFRRGGFDGPIEHQETATTPIIEYAFLKNATYTLFLNVTDDEGEWWAGQWDTTRLYGRQITIVYRDIAITKIYSSNRVVKSGDNVSIYVTVDNFGSAAEIFNVTAYYFNSTDTVAIETKEDHLAPHPPTWPPPPNYPPFNKTLTFNWTTAGVPLGDYTVKAVVEELPGENNVTNNVVVDGLVALSTTNIITYVVVVNGGTFDVVMASNSTVTGFVFDVAKKQISFSVEGPDGLFGAANITVPKRLLSNQTGPWVLMWDGSAYSHAVIMDANATHTFFNLTYPTSKHNVQIIGTEAVEVDASFTASTTKAYVAVPVTFDASASHDPYPGAFINSYKWDIGIANSVTIIDTIVNDKDHPVLDYAFATERFGSNAYNVTLTVTSDSGVTNSSFRIIQAFENYNIAVTDISVSASSVAVGDTVAVNVTVRNTLAIGGALQVNVTLFRDDVVVIGRQITAPSVAVGTNRILQFVWNTTGLTLANHTLRASAEVIGYGTAPDFPPESNLADNVFVLSEPVAVTKWSSRVGISLSVTSITYGGGLTINGNVTRGLATPVGVDVTVTIYQRAAGSENWVVLTKVLTNAAGKYVYVWTPTAAGTFQVKAGWTGDSMTESGESQVIGVAVNKATSQVSLSLSAVNTQVGKNVTLSGKIQPTRGGVTVTILLRPAAGTFATLTTVTTDANGNYGYLWAPSTVGTFQLQATWGGDANTDGDQSDIMSVIVGAAPAQPTTEIPWNLIGYAAVGIIVVIAIAVYFLRIRKPKK